ncbi:class I SAM-dependent methyltransferase [Candidatus Neomarinimicrobiota bacterium]
MPSKLAEIAPTLDQLTTCPVCQASTFRPVMNLRDHMISGESFSLVECSNCTLRLLNPRPGPDEITSYYKSDEYVSHSGTSSGLINRLYRLAQTYTMNSKRKLVIKTSGKKRGKLLDLGCGRGMFLHTMQAAGWQVRGLEPNEAARAWCKQEYGLPVLPMEQLVNIPTQSIDIITMWHVLEHVHDLVHVLKEIRRILTHDGRLILALPNYTSFDAKFYRGHWAGYDAPRHLYHFNRVVIEQLGDRQGFRLLGSSRMLLDSFYVSMLSEKYLAGKGWMLRGLWIGLRSLALSLRSGDRGSSIIYLLSKAETPLSEPNE